MIPFVRTGDDTAEKRLRKISGTRELARQEIGLRRARLLLALDVLVERQALHLDLLLRQRLRLAAEAVLVRPPRSDTRL